MRTARLLIGLWLSVLVAVIVAAPIQANVDAPAELGAGAGKAADVHAIEAKVRQMRKAAPLAKWNQVKAAEAKPGAKSAIKAARTKHARYGADPRVSKKTIAADIAALNAMAIHKAPASPGAPAAKPKSSPKPASSQENSREKSIEAKIRAMRKPSKPATWNEVQHDETKWKTASAPTINDLGASNTPIASDGGEGSARREAGLSTQSNSKRSDGGEGSARAARSHSTEQHASNHASASPVGEGKVDPFHLSYLERAHMQEHVNAQLVPKPYAIPTASVKADEAKLRAGWNKKPMGVVRADYDKAMKEAKLPFNNHESNE